MIDFNRGSGSVPGQLLPLNSQINKLIDSGVIAHNRQQAPRDYLGASAIGAPCARQLYYDLLPGMTGCEPVPITQHAWSEFWDENEDAPFDGKTLRIFATGHKLEDLIAEWIRMGGFDLIMRSGNDKQFHVQHPTHPIGGNLDGEIIYGPLDLPYPLVWDAKTLKAKKYQELVKYGLKDKFPLYYSQMQIYCHYRGRKAFWLTGLNKDTGELRHVIEPYDQHHAEDIIRRGEIIVESVHKGEVPDMISEQKDYYICRMCRYLYYCKG